MRFVGRQHEMSWLDGELARADRGRGRLVAVRGRRQVGKSRLLTEWVERTGRPSLYYQARGATPEFELAAFSDAARRSSLSGLADLVDAGVTWPSWDAALGTLARTLDDQGPAPVVVIDEFPYLIGDDSCIEGVLQAIWDHQLSRRPILLILVGSDLAMMETIATYGRPLYGRVDTQRQLDPLGIPDVAKLLDVAATDAIDTYLMTGGFPKIIASLDEVGNAGALLDAAVQDEAHRRMLRERLSRCSLVMLPPVAGRRSQSDQADACAGLTFHSLLPDPPGRGRACGWLHVHVLRRRSTPGRTCTRQGVQGSLLR